MLSRHLILLFWLCLSWHIASEEENKHWSFRSLEKPSPPLKHLSGIDGFIQTKLHDKGLQIQEESNPRTLLRRLYFDMTGLPPSFEDIHAFSKAEDRDLAYKEAIEKVLASPRYGERWAQHWLDLVRYADTHGYEVNTERKNAWPYRDYVIQAFNEDKPYDQFVFEQLAGDTVGENRATGFLVAAPALLPGQIGKDEASKRLARQDALDEIIVSTGETFLGISIGCARCHDHKFDPVTAKDYYAFQAFFAGVEYGDRPVEDAVERQRRTKNLTKITQRLKSIDQQLDLLEPIAATRDLKAPPRRNPVNHTRNIERFRPIQARSIRFTILETQDNNRHEPCLDEVEIYGPGSPNTNVALSKRGVRTSSSGNYSETGIHQLKHVNEGLYGNDHSWISNKKGEGWVQFELPEPTEINRIIWSRDRTGQFKDRLAIRYRIEVTVDKEKWTPIAGSWDRVSFQSLDSKSPIADDPEIALKRKHLLDERNKLIARKKVLMETPMIYGGKFRKPDTTYVLHRGDPEQPGDAIHPSIPGILGQLGLEQHATESERRVTLAHWIANPNHPLTARVMVNRIWQFHFGKGLVDTPNDFGLNGSPPTHPELLDWLAAEFIESGWSIKHVHRLILQSKTYRQSGQINHEGVEQDAGVRYLWRFPSRRLEGEAIRDSILHTSGTLNFDMGGPGFDFFKKRGGLDGYPPVNEFGAEGMRRMIYAHKVRMERVPVFGAFDCPDAGQPMPKRNQSTTAIQALNLFNSPFVLNQSKRLAKRIENQGTPYQTSVQKVESAFQITLGRNPSQSELKGALILVHQEGLASLCRVLFNSSEFIFIP